jgi:mono/diheme cytochrome c family protein
VVSGLLVVALLSAQGGWATADAERVRRGQDIYRNACIHCHGEDGGGNPEWESDVRPVAFSDCGTTAEPTEQWETIVKRGGPSRGLHAVMPAFEEAFDDDEIRAVVAYLRTFCRNADAYPPGDLNFRRLLRTGKAFPEAEVVVRPSHRPDSSTRETELEVVYENRVGPRFQYELVLPMRLQASGGDGRGLGDVEVEGKQVLHFDVPRLSILSAGLGVTLPTGRESAGLGDDTASFSPFLAYGKGWSRTFLQARIGAKLTVDPDKAPRELSYALAVSRALGPPRVAWTPAVELIGGWNARDRRHESAVVLEVSKPLNRLGHVIGALGVQIPLRPREATYRIEAYLLWDFGDGPVWVGW